MMSFFWIFREVRKPFWLELDAIVVEFKSAGLASGDHASGLQPRSRDAALAVAEG
jgi:hypothetical protein